MSIQKNVKVSFSIASLLLVATVAGLVATKTVEIDQPSMKTQGKPEAPRTYFYEGRSSSTPFLISHPKDN
ncbi:TPA: hypothetical protein L5C15_005768 [Pseudomonas aeruginosa]|uniref:hypothetical protein n=1 Tax=Pseudomonas aeruginosa TaxID=287 RepID=UPI0009410068|nr:hypothetical protein [Pseudomonas aeruginosa]OKS33355.1 hypothetical protein BH608_18015 [Pseudomonas aeruginosa]HBO7934631.1 hypothetical protein [Pseudomonas aeruginosa]HBO8188573.1 hypothetical protein [Pseudomonas aeruginosa]HBO8713822.1 hypothetical protein [Pseudomonas aeruginosa]